MVKYNFKTGITIEQLLTLKLRARCPSIFSSIAIELNVPRDEFSSIAIELTFVALRRGFKKSRGFKIAGSVLFDIGDSWDKDCISHICMAGRCYGCV